VSVPASSSDVRRAGGRVGTLWRSAGFAQQREQGAARGSPIAPEPHGGLPHDLSVLVAEQPPAGRRRSGRRLDQREAATSAPTAVRA
jgi:hypothetical protein